MKKLVIRESNGHYHLENFGPSFTGADGRSPFTLVVESKGRGLYLEFPEATLFDLFTRFDLRDPSFGAEAYHCADFLRVSEEAGEWVVTAGTGSLYDFFRERLASGRCLLRVSRPVTFAWRASEEAA